MDYFNSTQPAPRTQNGENTIALFLGLYLLILAFFILMVSISTRETVRSEAVMDSLTSTFSSLLPPSTDLTAFTSKQGNVLAGRRFLEAIAGIFTTAIQVARIEIVQPGRIMHVTLPANTMFFTDEARIRTSKLSLIDRIVTNLSQAPDGLRFDMDFVIGTKPTGDGLINTDGNLETARAGAFAKEMSARGAPPDNVAVGIKPSDPNKIEIWFYVRNKNEGLIQAADLIAVR